MATEALEVQIRADAAAFTKGMNEAIAGLNRLVGESKKANAATQSMSKNMNTVANSVKAFGAGLALAIGTQIIGSLQQLAAEFVKLAEAPTQFKASLEALTGSSARAEDMLQRVYAVAKRTGTGFEDTASLVQRLTIGLNSLGANNAQIAQITENILKLGTIGGSSIADTAAAALQLSQALASGKLQGDELRSIMERMPTLMQILAKEMGVGVGELKKLGAEGKITSDIIANSLLKATAQIEADFKKMPLTVGQAMNNVKTSIQQAFDNPAAKAAVQGLARAINLIPIAIRAVDLEVRNFIRGLSSFGRSMATLFEPVMGTLTRLGQGLSRLAGIVSSVFPPLKNIIIAALVGPVVTIISNWDKVRSYFENQIPAMFYNMVGAAQDAMAAVVGIFQNAWNTIIGIVQNAVNSIIAGINAISGAMNGLAGQLGSGPLLGEIGKIDLGMKDLTNTTNGWRAAAAGSYQIASQYAQRYATDLRTIARTTAEAASQAEAGSTPWEGLAGAIQKVSDAAVGGGGGGGGKGGGAAGGLKKAGDAAKKAAQDMKAAQSMVEEFGQAMQSIAQSLGSGVVDALFSIAEGSKSAKEAFTELAKSMLKQIAQMIMQLLILKPLMGMFGGMFGGGGGIGLMSGAGGVAAFRSIGSSPGNPAVGDYTGFNLQPGVQSMRSSLVSSGYGSNNLQAPMTVNINNASTASVKTRRENDGSLTVDIIEEIVADRITRGGNKIDSAIQRAFGTRRVGY